VTHSCNKDSDDGKMADKHLNEPSASTRGSDDDKTIAVHAPVQQANVLACPTCDGCLEYAGNV